jgi:2-keto-3-deoxy-L-fuconate dehydrogenase
MDRLRGKTAFCTAAGQGIGRAVALAFAREGAHVVASDVDPDKLEGLKQDGVAQTLRLDVLSSAMVAEVAGSVPAPDILFNCAGFVHHGTVLDCSDEDWAFSFDLNVTSMHRTIRHFLPGMLEKGGGSIVNIASVASSIKAAQNRYAYGATKAAVIGLTKAVALDFIGRGIRCNCICPGTVQSPSLDERIESLGNAVGGAEKARDLFVARQPMGRLGTPEEIAAVAVYLASDEAAFTTGQAFVVDGGFTL